MKITKNSKFLNFGALLGYPGIKFRTPAIPMLMNKFTGIKKNLTEHNKILCRQIVGKTISIW